MKYLYLQNSYVVSLTGKEEETPKSRKEDIRVFYILRDYGDEDILPFVDDVHYSLVDNLL